MTRDISAIFYAEERIALLRFMKFNKRAIHVEIQLILMLRTKTKAHVLRIY